MMERKFKVLNTIINKGSFFEYILAIEGDIITQNEYGFMVGLYSCPSPYDQSYLEGWMEEGFIEEIIEPNKKPNLTGQNTNIEEDIYSKKYNIYEILTLIPNIPKDSKFKCSLDDEEWYV